MDTREQLPVEPVRPLSLLLNEVERARADGNKRLAVNLINLIFEFQDQRELIDLLLRLPDSSVETWKSAVALVPSVKPVSLAGLSFFSIAEAASDVILVTNSDVVHPGPLIVYVNDAFTRLTGYSANEVIGRSPRLLQGPGTSRSTLDRINEGLRFGRPIHEKLLNYARNGAPFWIDLRIVPITNAMGELTHFAAVERDVTMDKRRLDELETLEDRDALTGISNRRALMRAMTDEIERARLRSVADGDTRNFCILAIKIASFDKMRLRLGPTGANAILFGLADRLSENVRRLDVLGRIEDAQFLVCMPMVPLQSAVIFADHLRRATVAEPIATQFGPVSIVINIGIAALERGESLESLLDRADANCVSLSSLECEATNSDGGY